MASQAMMNEWTDEEFEKHTFDLIVREFGVGGLARFIRLNRSGKGDYTAERHQWLDGLTMDEILRDLHVESGTSSKRS